MEDIEPTEAVQMYLADKQPEHSQATIYSHRSRLSHFTDWCAGEGDIQYLSELDPLDCHRYKLWRRNEHDINNVTLKTQLDTLRVMLRWAEATGLAQNDISEAVLSPSLSDGENERDVMLDPEAAQAILEYLEKYEYASTDHVTMLLLWRCILRRGALRAIDTDDCELDTDTPVIEVEHRPETDTPLKNQYDGERVIALKHETSVIVNDHIDTHRHDVEDDYGREPLVTTSHGRPHVQTIQATAYANTRPCAVGQECPHGRDPEACDAAQNRQIAYECPSSVSPHAIRRGAITHWLKNDVPKPAVSDRADVQSDTLDKHYDQRSERQKAEQRRRFLDDV